MAADVYPVHQLTRYLRELLEHNRHLHEIWVSGEVSNLSRASSGHIYFTLSEGGAALRCVFFRSRNLAQRELLTEGISLLVHGSLTVYEPRGELSFIVEFVQPEGAGAQRAEFERLRAKLEAEGLFAQERKRAFPRFPQRIGVVTSPTGAVFHDITDVIARRWPLVTVLLQPTPVQGDGAGPSTAEAIRTLTREAAPDLVILARGGGSAEDLSAFNSEVVARAVAASPVPVVSAIGHETDVTLADLAADMRAPTPSAAAELVVPDRAEVSHRIDAMIGNAELRLEQRITAAQRRLDAHVSALDDALPDVAAHRLALQHLATRCDHALRVKVDQTRERSAALRARLEALSPLSTLRRGYAIVDRADGTHVGSAASLQVGELVSLRMHDGSRPARITDPAELEAEV